jgi:hypothetical protein
MAESGDTITLKVPGGRVGDSIYSAEGAPTLQKGEQLMVFVQRHWTSGSPRVHEVLLPTGGNVAVVHGDKVRWAGHLCGTDNFVRHLNKHPAK